MIKRYRRLRKPNAKTETMIQLYAQGLSGTQIALKLNLAKSSVTRRLKKAGIQLRSSSGYEKANRYWLWKGQDYIDPVTRKRNQRKHREWSHTVLKRDKYKCVLCGEGEKKLESHHIISLRECINTSLEFDINNGITLCIPCHRSIHKSTNRKG